MPHNRSSSDPNNLRFRLLRDTELDQLGASSWLIEGFLPEGGLCVLFGMPGTGKTFLALDAGLSVGTGLDWLGGPVKQGNVVYVAAEGGWGLRTRVEAWKLNRGVDDFANCHFLPGAVQLSQSKELEALLALLKSLPKPIRLVVIDTMSRCFVGGDENSSQHVSAFIAAADQIRKETGAAVLLLHHSPKKDKNTARGSGALEGAADTMMLLEKDNKTKSITLKCTKQKDAQEFQPISLMLVSVQLPNGHTSCVVEEVNFQPSNLSLAAGSLKALKILDGLGSQGATATEWEKEFIKVTNMSQRTFYRALDSLENNGFVQRSGHASKGERYTLTEKGRKAVTVT